MSDNAQDAKSPFKFLDAYNKDDHSIFFGRENETLELYDRLSETNLVILYGASGTGKTSLINCGLMNEFESADWFPIFVRRKENLLAEWKKAISKVAQKEVEEEASLKERVYSLYLDYFKPVYFIFDQFEELFVLGSKEEQVAFFEELKVLLQASKLQCKFILSMREEYLANLSEFETTIPALLDNRLRIERMNKRHLKDVIVGTTKAFNIKLADEEKIPEEIIERLKGKHNEIDLANLQVYLDRLYRFDAKRNTNPPIFDQDLLERTGDLEDVMSQFLDEQLEILEEELRTMGVQEKGIPLDVLFALVTDNGTKQVASIEDIRQHLHRLKGIEERIVDYCIARFKDMRILRELA